MKKQLISIFALLIIVLFGTKSFGQVDFKIQNMSGYQLYGLMVSQDGGEDWSDDLLTTSEFPNNTETVVTIPEGYTCTIFIKVTYMVNSQTYEEILGTADVCNHSGIKIIKNPKGKSGDWMNTQYLD
jgi:hypothetical protein